jgi:hypothetical protein
MCLTGSGDGRTEGKLRAGGEITHFVLAQRDAGQRLLMPVFAFGTRRARANSARATPRRC